MRSPSRLDHLAPLPLTYLPQFKLQGLAHTLEQLDFIGTSSHPRGHIDFLAKRALSSGTSAYFLLWQWQDHIQPGLMRLVVLLRFSLVEANRSMLPYLAHDAHKVWKRKYNKVMNVSNTQQCKRKEGE